MEKEVLLTRKKMPSLKKGFLLCGILLAVLMIMFLISCGTGKYRLSLLEILSTLFGGGDKYSRITMFQVRLPRTCLAVLVGIGMGVAGVVMQNLLRNDLASPGTLGVSSGSGLFITVYVALFKTKTDSAIVLPILALIGGILAAGIIFLLGTKRKQPINPTRLILTGVATGSAYSAVSTFLMYMLDTNKLEFLQRWQSGELWGTEFGQITILAVWLLIFCSLIYGRATTLNVINLGYDTAKGLGVNVGRQFVYLSLCAVAVSSATVAFGGNFFFLGLIGPHIARQLVGTDARVLLPASGLVAAIIVVLADIFVRAFDFLSGIPTGIVISILSVPYFIYLLLRNKRW